MARILETILPESIRNEGLLFVPQVLEDLMRGKLDREFPVRLDEGEDPASARTYAFDVARRLYKTFADSLTQANYKVVTRKFVVKLLDNALGWNFDRAEALACSEIPFLVPPFSRRGAETQSGDREDSDDLEELLAPSNLCASAPLREPDYLPLYEAKLIHQFDHRWATYEADGSTHDVTNAEKQNAGFEIRPRYWVAKEEVDKRLTEFSLRQDSENSTSSNPVSVVQYLMGWRDMARATDARIVISAIFPVGAVGNNLFLYHPTQAPNLKACLNADMNYLVHDWCARQKVGGVHVSFFVSNQIATLAPTAYTQADIDYIVPRVLELTYTSHSLKGWAEALGYTGEPFVFDPERRAVLRAELDARYAKLYGLNEQELTYILDPSAVYGPDYPSESFRVLKEKEIAEFGEYRTMRMVLEAFRKDTRQV